MHIGDQQTFNNSTKYPLLIEKLIALDLNNADTAKTITNASDSETKIQLL